MLGLYNEHVGIWGHKASPQKFTIRIEWEGNKFQWRRITTLPLFPYTEEIDRGTEQSHYGKYGLKGYNLHFWYLISSVVESQSKDPPKIAAKR